MLWLLSPHRAVVVFGVAALDDAVDVLVVRMCSSAQAMCYHLLNFLVDFRVFCACLKKNERPLLFLKLIQVLYLVRLTHQ